MSLYSCAFRDIDGSDFDLAALKGKVVVVTNVASQ
jgi:glutathione peroxidase-family protein